MNIIYLGVGYPAKGDRNIYTDLMEIFMANGHTVTVVCSSDGVQGTMRERENNKDVLRVATGAVTGNISIIKKGLSTLLVDYYFKKAIKQNLADEKYDLILCSTPPITLVSTIAYLKKKNRAQVFLMLKDIFPQNAVDIGMMRKGFILYPYFRYVEKKLYKISDYVGCMSEANIRYIQQNNPYLNLEKLCLCVNSCSDIPQKEIDIPTLRKKYAIPEQAVTFVYGGNLGKPQGIDFLVRFLGTQIGKNDRFFLICGKGKEAYKIGEFMNIYKPENMRYIPWLPYDEYETLVLACDVGLLFLDYRFTIPNFPSRLLSLMRSGLPVLAATDTVTDISRKIYDGDFGWWCESTDEKALNKIVDDICTRPNLITEKGKNARACFLHDYTTETTYAQIINAITKKNGKNECVCK